MLKFKLDTSVHFPISSVVLHPLFPHHFPQDQKRQPFWAYDETLLNLKKLLLFVVLILDFDLINNKKSYEVHRIRNKSRMT